MDFQFADTWFSLVTHHISINHQESVSVARMGIYFTIYADSTMPIVLCKSVVGPDDLGRIRIAIDPKNGAGPIGNSVDSIVLADNADVPLMKEHE